MSEEKDGRQELPQKAEKLEKPEKPEKGPNERGKMTFRRFMRSYGYLLSLIHI